MKTDKKIFCKYRFEIHDKTRDYQSCASTAHRAIRCHVTVVFSSRPKIHH